MRWGLNVNVETKIRVFVSFNPLNRGNAMGTKVRVFIFVLGLGVSIL